MWRRIMLAVHCTALLNVALMGALATPASAQDPTGRPTENPSRRRTNPPRRTTPRPDPSPPTVILTILTQPGEAAVFINGEERGRTNAEGKAVIEKLPLGRYTVEVRKDGFLNGVQGFQAGTDSPTLVFKLEPDFAPNMKQFDDLVAAGKLTGPDSPNAFELIDQLAEQFPDRPEIARMRGVLAARLSETFQPTIEQTVTGWRAVPRDQIEAAMNEAINAQALKGDDARLQAQAAYLRGALALRNWQMASGAPAPEGGDVPAGLAAARAEFENAVKAEQSYAPAVYQLGVVMLAMGDVRGAEGAFVRAILLEPRWSVAHAGLGQAYYAQRRYNEAIASFRKAVELDSRNAVALAGLGLARFAKGEKDGLKDIERASQVDPTSGVPHLNLGIAYGQSKKSKDRERAVAELKKAVQLNRDNLEFQNAVAEQLIASLEKKK